MYSLTDNHKFGSIGWKLWEHQMTPNWTQIISYQKYPTFAVHITLKPNFHPFHSMISRFQEQDVPIDSYVKISKCHKSFNIWPIANKSNSMYSPW